MAGGGQYYTYGYSPSAAAAGVLNTQVVPHAVVDSGSDAAQANQASMANAREAAAAQTNAARLQSQAQVKAALASAQASMFGSSQQLAGVQAQLGYKQGVFGKVFPLLQSQIGAAQQPTSFSSPNPQGYVTDIAQLSGGRGGRGGGAGADFASAQNPLLSRISDLAANPIQAPDALTAPTLPTYNLPQFQQASLLNPADMPVISRDLLNQQKNAARAQTQTQAATQIQQTRSGVGGRGLGASSPLAQGLAAQIGAGAIGAISAGDLAAENAAADRNAQYAQAMNQALIGQAAQVYGSQVSGTEGAYSTDVNAQQAMYNAQLGLQGAEYGTQGSMYNAGLGALEGMYGQQLGYAGQMGSAALNANTSIYGTNVGYQQAMNVAEIQRQTQSQNAILQALAGMANG